MASYDKRTSGWSVRFWFGGKQVRLSGFPRKSDAEKAYREYLLTENMTTPTTFEEMAKKYLDSRKLNVTESTIVSNESRLRTHIYPLIGNKPIDKITADDLERVKESIVSFSSNYKSHIWTILGGVFRYAYKRYGCNTLQVYERIEPFSKSNNKKDYWTPNEFRTFINCVKNEYTASNDYVHYRYYILFNFLYFIGTRKGEMMALTWNDIDLKKATIVIDKSVTNKLSKESREKGLFYKVTDTKTHKERIIDIPGQLLELLIDYKKKEKPKPTDYVFFKERPIAPETLRREFDHYITLAGVKRITPHQFRHSNASLIISNGGNNELAVTYVLAERLGNSPKMIMEVYGNLFESAKKDIVSKIKL